MAAAAAFVVALAAVASTATAAGPLRTAVVEPSDFALSDADTIYSRIRGAGATLVRTTLSWYAIAPRDKRPADPTNPNDPGYDWSRSDAKVQEAFAHGLEPYLVVTDAPVWARVGQKGAGAPPTPGDLAAFMRAAAERYSGRHAGLPRIRSWQIWIEPNVNKFFKPQFQNGKAVAPMRYAALVDAATLAVHRVRADNKLIAGGLSPFTVTFGETKTTGPMAFMREMLCMTAKNKPKPGCNRRIHFDIWSHHPFTTGGPYHHARRADDISLGDLPEMKALLAAAFKYGHAIALHMPAFWVTEFSWDTSPPDKNAVPIKLHARWTAEALYVMWKAGISVVTWLDLRDHPYPSEVTQSGLYWRGASLAQDKPKPSLTSFKFPLVAYKRAKGVYVWGRTPWGKAGRVTVQWRSGRRWKTIGTFATNRYGIFSRVVKAGSTGFVRASAAGSRSLGFSLKQPPDRLFRPFG